MSNEGKYCKDSEYTDWVRTGEAADMLGISDVSVRKLVREGYLQAYRVRGISGIQFRRGDVLSLIEKVDPSEFDEDR